MVYMEQDLTSWKKVKVCPGILPSVPIHPFQFELCLGGRGHLVRNIIKIFFRTFMKFTLSMEYESSWEEGQTRLTWRPRSWSRMTPSSGL